MFGSNYPQELNRTGNTLAKIKEKIRSELADHEKYPIYRYDNYPLNWDLIPLQMDINSMLFQEYLKGVPYLSAMITYLLLIKRRNSIVEEISFQTYSGGSYRTNADDCFSCSLAFEV